MYIDLEHLTEIIYNFSKIEYRLQGMVTSSNNYIRK